MDRIEKKLTQYEQNWFIPRYKDKRTESNFLITDLFENEDRATSKRTVSRLQCYGRNMLFVGLIS
jgi:hypothetical protein